MKLLLTADAVGGVWIYALELARALGPYGVTITLATMGDAPSAEQQRQAAALANVTLHVSTFRLEWTEHPWDDVRRAGDWLLQLERQFRPDVIHLNGYAHGALPWRAPVMVVGHSCVLSWWRAVKGEDAPPPWRTYREAVAAGLRAADLVVAPSAAMLDALCDHYGPLPDSRMIHNGRDPTPYRHSAGGKGKDHFILTAGRLWDEAKNVAALCRIAPRLPWPVCVAGEQKHPGGGTRPGHENVVSLGKLDEATLADWFCCAGIYALPARYEPFGLSALEAALSGCALVLGDIPSLREVWGDAAAYVPPGDDAALERVLRDLIDDGTRRHDLSRRALLRAKLYSPQCMASAYVDAYERLRAARAGTRAKGAIPCAS